MWLLSEKLNFFQDYEEEPASHLYVQMQLGSSPNPRTTEKRRFAFHDSSLSFLLLNDMLTAVS